MFLPVLVAAPWAWSIRAQMLALPLYTGLLWLLASQARAPSNRIWLAFPLLVVWANVHGSVALGALLVMLLGAYELFRSRAGTWKRSAALILLAPLDRPRDAVRPGRDGALLPPPPRRPAVRGAGHGVELGGAGGRTRSFFYALAAIALVVVWLGRRRLNALRHRRPRAHVRRWRERDSRDRLVRARVHGLRPGRDRPQAREQEAGRAAPRPQRRDHDGPCRRRRRRRGLALPPDEEWFEEYWPREAVEAVRAEVEPDDRVFAPDRFSDWMLFKIPELRGRIAYDVRFEIYDREFFDRLQDYDFERRRRTGSRSPTATASSSSTRRASRTPPTSSRSRARASIYRDDEITIVARRARAQARDAPEDEDTVSLEDHRPRRIVCPSRAASRPNDVPGGWVSDGESERRRPRDRRDRRRPRRRRPTSGHDVDVLPRRQMGARRGCDAVTAAPSGTSATASLERGDTRSAGSSSRPPSGRRARRRGPRPEEERDSRRADETRRSLRAPAAAPRTRAIPKTVAAIRNGIDRRDAVVPRVGHRPEVRQRVRERAAAAPRARARARGGRGQQQRRGRASTR